MTLPLLWGGWLLIGVGVLLILLALAGVEPVLTPTPTPTPEPLVPTRTPTSKIVVSTATGVPSTPASAATITPPTSRATPHSSRATLYQNRPRWGVGVAIGPISRYNNVETLRLGWYLDWHARRDPPRPGNLEYVQVVRLKHGTLQPDVLTIAAIAQTHPGSLWLIGNEPDVKWQDNVEPVVYARLYHQVYLAIKKADPTAQVAIGGVSQPTPLRLRYLEAVLAAYQEQFGVEMPVDVWNVHNFVLREERGSWGVDIPPGMSDNRGMLYEVDDSGNVEIFQQQIVNFRQWMATRGYQNRPLIVSEYGILMPEDYGFPPERVVAFLTSTFDFFLTATDAALGYPADSYRLVQRWCWYSLADTEYPTGNLLDPATGKMTEVGKRWAEFVKVRLGSQLLP